MTGPAARDPLPGEPEHRDRWRDTARSASPDDEDARMVEEALHCAETGNAGHWPTAAAFLAQEIYRLRAAPSVAPQPTVPRAPVEALLAALDRNWLSVGDAVAEVRRHLDTTTNQPEEGQ